MRKWKLFYNFISRNIQLSSQKSGKAIRGILEDYDYEFVHFVKGIPPRPQVYKLSRRGRFFALKIYRSTGSEPNGVLAHRDVLPRIHNFHNRLILPQWVATGALDDVNYFVIMTWEKGHDFNGRWSLTKANTRGGKSIQIYTVKLVLELIEDLYNICTESFSNVQLRPQRQECSQRRIFELLTLAGERHLITEEEILCSQDILQQIPFGNENNMRKMLSNGDFQFRNLIEKSADKTAIIDWDEAKISAYELEHCVAYQWMLMWNNPPWQRAFLSGAKQLFPLDKYRFRSLLLFNSLRQAMLLSYRPELANVFIECLRKTLRDQHYNFIWN